MHTHASHGAVDIRPYMAVFGALLVLTLVTVAVSSLDLATTPTVLLGVAIATVKASLVAMFFMHLRSERATVYWTLGFTAFFFVALMGFVLWAEADHLTGTRFTGAFEERAE